MVDKRIIEYTEAASAGADYYLVTDSTSDGVKKIKPANIVPAFTGDVTKDAGGTVTTIANNAVTNTKAAQMAAGTIKSNLTGASANSSDNTINTVMDAAFGSVQGAVAYRGASGWTSLAPGASGQFFQTSGPAANPIWQNIPGGGNMLSTNNLSDVASTSTSLTNLGGTSVGKALFTAADKATARAVIVSDTYYNGQDLGIIADNSTDNAATIATILSGMSGGVLMLPRGITRYASIIDLTGKSGVTLRGCGPANTTGNAPASTLRYTGATTDAIKLGSAFGCNVEDLWLDYTNSSLTGNLILIGNTTGSDAQFNAVRRCLIWSGTSLKTAVHLNIDKSVGTIIEECNFLGGNPSIKGRSSSGYAIRTHIHRCQFGLSADYPIYSPDDAWTISNCDFVADSGGFGRVLTGGTSATPSKNLSLLNNWSGDVTTTGATAIRLYGFGLLSQNNSWGGLAGSNCFGLNNFTNFKISLDTFDHFGTAVSYDTTLCDYGAIEYCHRVSTTNLEGSTGNKGTNVVLTNNN